MGYDFDFSAVFSNWRLLLMGLQNSIILGATCLTLGLSLGLVVGAMRYARAPVLNWPATAFIEVFRNTPVLVQIMWKAYPFDSS